MSCKMSCKDKGYEVGQVFETKGSRVFKDGSIIILVRDDGSHAPYFGLIKGGFHKGHGYNCHGYCDLDYVNRIWPPEKDTVTVICEGKEKEISRKFAKALDLI